MVRVKDLCLAYVEELLKGKQKFFTVRNSIVFKSYSILMFAYLVGSLKNHERFEFCNIWDKLELVCQSLLSQAEIESVLINQDKRYGVKILQNLKNMWFDATLHEKISISAKN